MSSLLCLEMRQTVCYTQLITEIVCTMLGSYELSWPAIQLREFGHLGSELLASRQLNWSKQSSGAELAASQRRSQLHFKGI